MGVAGCRNTAAWAGWEFAGWEVDDGYLGTALLFFLLLSTFEVFHDKELEGRKEAYKHITQLSLFYAVESEADTSGKTSNPN